MKYRITFKLERGSPSGLVQHAVSGQVIESDYFEINPAGVISFWRNEDPMVPAARHELRRTGQDDPSTYVKVLVKAYSPDTWRTVELVLGAEESNSDENSPRRPEEKRQVRSP